MGLANISIVGNVVRQPLQTKFGTGNTVTTIQVAVNKPVKKGAEQETEFYKVEAWNKLGDLAANYLVKGQQVTVIGRFTIERWQDKEGRDRFTPVVNAQQLSLPQKRSGYQAPQVDLTDYAAMTPDQDGELKPTVQPERSTLVVSNGEPAKVLTH